MPQAHFMQRAQQDGKKQQQKAFCVCIGGMCAEKKHKQASLLASACALSTWGRSPLLKRIFAHGKKKAKASEASRIAFFFPKMIASHFCSSSEQKWETSQKCSWFLFFIYQKAKKIREDFFWLCGEKQKRNRAGGLGVREKEPKRQQQKKSLFFLRAKLGRASC